MELILGIVWLHFLADFLLQTDKMAVNKSKSMFWLGVHALVYSIPFFILGWKFAVFNGVAHWGVDAITSRVNSKLWAAEERHWFFTMIGFDQAVHITTLLLSASYLFATL